MKSFKKTLSYTLLIIACATLISCGVMRSSHYSSSAVQYLYPNQDDHIETPSIPRLSLPLKIGIAFVPEGTGKSRTLTERDKIDLMNKVSKNFKSHDFVQSIELIPSVYLREKGSFANLDQLRTMYGIDVIALLSYDQTQFTDEGLASITYWTLVGAYIIPGEKNATNTMLDASVYDIQSRRMLFRAPGTSHIKSKSTPINLSEQLRIDSLESFKEASEELVSNLEIQLDLFKDKVKELPTDYQITHKPGYTGGGSLDLSIVIFLLSLLAYWLWMQRSRRA
ncbi:rhombotarget lipoprotein [Microbulbifer spongiae]|uniref:Rhombotarget lipoprotein n=1 Tax=Microbulbifer spongiae TaxID=2944933 RepID=A0ABY9EAP1_9GAMM|nr:rhombotarget lipoprotein [Microbulbifer sp. MI-G]WKD49382.1 rhombotarget lipoprotein [Microbulbifer sp. MI-G]